eukprot:1054497_1
MSPAMSEIYEGIINVTQTSHLSESMDNHHNTHSSQSQPPLVYILIILGVTFVLLMCFIIYTATRMLFFHHRKDTTEEERQSISKKDPNQSKNTEDGTHSQQHILNVSNRGSDSDSLHASDAGNDTDGYTSNIKPKRKKKKRKITISTPQIHKKDGLYFCHHAIITYGDTEYETESNEPSQKVQSSRNSIAKR